MLMPYELLIGTGDNDSDDPVHVSLMCGDQESNSLQPAQGSGRDNYERGSIEIFDPLNFELSEEPTAIKINFRGKKWRVGGLWLTDKTTGKSWHSLPNALIGSDAGGGTKVFPLQSLKPEDYKLGLFDKTHTSFRVIITTGTDGTNDPVFIKLFDAAGLSNITQRPGEADNVLNPINDWKAGSTQSALVASTLTEMHDVSHILLCKYGSNSWNPSVVTVEGSPLALPPGGPGPIRHFAITHSLTEANNKWIFCRSSDLPPLP